MTERKIYCFDCNRLIGKLDLDKGALRMLPGVQWELTGTCPDCLKLYENQKPASNMSVDDLLKLFGMGK